MSGICLFIALRLKAKYSLRKHSFEIGQLKMAVFHPGAKLSGVRCYFLHESVILRITGSFLA